MRSRYRFNEADRTYFITATIVEWLPVFRSSACCDILVNALLHCRQHKALQIHGWVIMDNHFHGILSSTDLSSTIRGLKGFTAQALVDQLKAERCDWLLNQLAAGYR
jgi:REP element-mobilizing transposase RayT